MAYVEIKNLKEAVNHYPEHAKESLDNLYHGKVYVVGRSEHVETIKKTKRGAEGYIKKAQSISWYDDYSQSMVTGGSGLHFVEMTENEILNPYDNKLIWYNWLRVVHGHDYLYNNVKYLAEKLGNEEIQKYVLESIEDMKNNRGLTVYEEEKETQNAITESHNNDSENEQQEEEVKENNNITYSLNEEMEGIEISFPDKPSQEIRDQLKINGFRWSKRQKIWYAKQSESRLNFVKELTGENEPKETITEKTFDYPEIEINDNETYTISQSLQDREQDANWIFRTQKRDHTKEIQELFSYYTNQVMEVLEETDNKRIIYYLKRDLQRFKKKYHENYIKMLESKANNPSWVVTGRAGRNASKYNKAMDRYDKLMGESVSLSNWIEKRIKNTKYDIKKEETDKVKKEIESNISNIDQSIQFKTESKELDVYGNGNKVKKRVYKAGNYFITKAWGMFRVYNTETGKEIETTLNTTSTLKDAKLFVTYLIQKQDQKAG